MGTSGDKIVLLDGMGSGSGSAANGLLSMIPGMFANLIGGNKMDPNLVAALMNGRNNQDGFGGANGWWFGSSSCSGYGEAVVLAMVLAMVMSVALMVFPLQ